jgi:hypothetical protein
MLTTNDINSASDLPGTGINHFPEKDLEQHQAPIVVKIVSSLFCGSRRAGEKRIGRFRQESRHQSGFHQSGLVR